MEERFIAFIIWGIIGLLFIVMGIYEFHSKKAKPFGFWANAEVAPIEDVKGYNRAMISSSDILIVYINWIAFIR